MAVLFSALKIQGQLWVKLHWAQDAQQLQSQLWASSPSGTALGFPFWHPSLENPIGVLGYKFSFLHFDGTVDATLANQQMTSY